MIESAHFEHLASYFAARATSVFSGISSLPPAFQSIFVSYKAEEWTAVVSCGTAVLVIVNQYRAYIDSGGTSGIPLTAAQVRIKEQGRVNIERFTADEEQRVRMVINAIEAQSYQERVLADQGVQDIAISAYEEMSGFFLHVWDQVEIFDSNLVANIEESSDRVAKWFADLELAIANWWSALWK
ncbi:hypothetical protein ABZ769_37250 [Streptomyces olivoreticuli]